MCVLTTVITAPLLTGGMCNDLSDSSVQVNVTLIVTVPRMFVLTTVITALLLTGGMLLLLLLIAFI